MLLNLKNSLNKTVSINFRLIKVETYESFYLKFVTLLSDNIDPRTFCVIQKFIIPHVKISLYFE